MAFLKRDKKGGAAGRLEGRARHSKVSGAKTRVGLGLRESLEHRLIRKTLFKSCAMMIIAAEHVRTINKSAPRKAVREEETYLAVIKSYRQIFLIIKF